MRGLREGEDYHSGRTTEHPLRQIWRLVHLPSAALGAGDNRVTAADESYGAIGTAAIGKEDFDISGELREILQAAGNNGFLIVDGDDEGELHRPHPRRKSRRT